MTADLKTAAQRALSAWDTTTLKTNGDGMLCEAMESLRAEFESAVMLNGLTEAETMETASVKGLAASPAEGDAMPNALRVALENLDATEPLGRTTEAVIDAAQRWYLAPKAQRKGMPASKEPHNGNDMEPRDPESFAYLDRRGDGEGQGLDSYWKWGYAAGWNDHKKHAAQSPAPAPERLPEALGEWLTAIGELYIAMGRPKFEATEPTMGVVETLREAGKRLADLQSSLDFYKRRCDALQASQSTMRDPERTMVCDILANGSLLINGQGKLAAERYAAPAPAVGAEQPWQAMLYAPRDGSKIELLVEHREYWIALKAGRADGYRQACEGHWVDFNGGGWSWMGTAGQPVGWRPLGKGGAVMSWEVWGTPPDPEPQRCPECGEESHLEGCELGKMQDRAIEAERKLYQAEGRINALERELASSQGCVSEWVKFGSDVTEELGLQVMSPKTILEKIARLRRVALHIPVGCTPPGPAAGSAGPANIAFVRWALSPAPEGWHSGVGWTEWGERAFKAGYAAGVVSQPSVQGSGQ